ncbi:hypothetical protein M0R04_11380 [Candidatus Dojkabacteria bacterium]|jgi:hypothetical protein|nr:hypothetical protein [Candidatus Dojkabacteria bacterium]
METTMQGLKEMLLKSYYGKQIPLDAFERKIVVQTVMDCYHSYTTIVFSINGSSPRGKAVMILEPYTYQVKGKLFIYKGERFSKPIDIEITDANISLIPPSEPITQIIIPKPKSRVLEHLWGFLKQFRRRR